VSHANAEVHKVYLRLPLQRYDFLSGRIRFVKMSNLIDCERINTADIIGESIVFTIVIPFPNVMVSGSCPSFDMVEEKKEHTGGNEVEIRTRRLSQMLFIDQRTISLFAISLRTSP
jgi:hypothetical protein